ncbi:hypothetical protein DKW60_22080 [Leucothrix pacifica]|uniref:Cytochrome c domain-containing protein n=1 Tax=Leucothrix pacifica TaxID=1247513 RepID=A0A317C0T8_9GAMM|nr:hypothetical protein DKW60_22080 [Leucothrix pacifica]
MKTFNFLYAKPSSKQDLPIGFALDRQNDEHFIVTKLRWKAKQKSNEPWIGMNCSACHTGKIEYKGASIVIDGAPGLIDFQGFIENFDLSLRQTFDDSKKLERFATKVLRTSPNPEQTKKIKSALKQLLTWQETTARLDRSSSRYGYGRLDAFGHIFNKTVMFANLDSKNYETSLHKMKGNKSDAPVSFPFLWGIQNQNKVQWNGIVENTVISTKDITLLKYFKKREIELGAIGRNSGEVLGVFGEAVIDEKTFKNFDKPLTALLSNGFKSSVNIPSLNGLEAKLKTLESPKWLKELPNLDSAKVKQGKQLFSAHGCNNCHTPTAAEITQGEEKTKCLNSDGTVPIIESKGAECMDNFSPSLNKQTAMAIKKAAAVSATDEDVDNALRSYTDILMACNALNYKADTGRLRGITINKSKMGEEALVSAMLTTTVKGVIFDNKRNTLNTAFKNEVEVWSFPPAMMTKPRKIPSKIYQCINQINELIESNGCQDSPKVNAICQLPYQLLAYKARPLDGIWATAPYLHNGSVPTLYDLLLPIDDRPKDFWVGSFEFDPKKVGYVTAQPEDGRATKLTTTVDGLLSAGNSNYGHDYNNNQMSDEDRWALVEYMKSL